MDSLKWNNAVLAADLVPKKTADSFAIPDDHTQLVMMAKVAEQTERYDEMVLCMKKIVKQNAELSQDERNLLSVAYKNVIGSRRSAWRIVTSIEARENEKGSSDNLAIIGTLRKQFEAELGAVCEDLLNLLDTYLIPSAPGGESKVFYLKMKGDYHRYWAEVADGEDQKKAALTAYEAAHDAAKKGLASTHPIRLGLVLNLSVFHYEILKQHETGFNLARTAYEEASGEIGGIEDEEEARESGLIVQLLEDNLKLWSEDQQ
uniref:14-3-3 domain-containing protein n=1 Tax=Neobodo designis TaxID=312471 RepID=A0A7S1QLY9_NEODS|mmetsp:Transcript_48453/g.149563  ORF Transcript_48453/g.149563 Transcript_48453/m.149563 type:complete len:261 (+) Transcript_48453:31-813(+)